MIYPKILLPVDGSDCANAGVSELVKIAADRGRDVHLIHVTVMPDWNDQFAPGTAGAIIKESYREAGLKILTAAQDELSRHGIVAVTLWLEAHGRRASELIVSHAQEWGADLIVMGTHGRRGVSRVLLGSNAADVVRTAPCPVLVVSATRA